MYCSHCAKNVSNNFKFCPVCGSHLPAPQFVPTPSSNIPIGKIIGISVLVLFLVGGAYLWFTEIGPEIQRMNENRERIEQQNRQVIQDRGFGNYDCTYSEISKVNNCIRVP